MKEWISNILSDGCDKGKMYFGCFRYETTNKHTTMLFKEESEFYSKTIKTIIVIQKKYINMQNLLMNKNYCNILLTHSKTKKWKHLAYYLTVNNKTQQQQAL